MAEPTISRNSHSVFMTARFRMEHQFLPQSSHREPRPFLGSLFTVEIARPTPMGVIAPLCEVERLGY
jgi:hypothetical protein